MPDDFTPDAPSGVLAPGAPAVGDFTPSSGNDQPQSGFFSSPGGFFGPGLLANIDARRFGITPEAARAQGDPALRMGLQGILGLLTGGRTLPQQMLSQGVAAGATSGLMGEGPLNAGLSAASAATGTGILGGGQQLGAKALSSRLLAPYTEQIGSAIAAQLQRLNPALQHFETTGKGLYEMLKTQPGRDAIHSAYDESLKEVVKSGVGVPVALSEKAAGKLGLTPLGEPAATDAGLYAARRLYNLASPKMQATIRAENPGIDFVGASNAADMVMVDAGKLALAMTGFGKGATYREAARALDGADIGDPAARAAYKAYMGFLGYFTKTPGALGPNGINLLKAQEGLGKAGKEELLNRDLGQSLDYTLNPTGQIVTRGNMSGPLAWGGTGLGTLGALAHPAASALTIPGGAWMGHKVGQYIPTYTGIPQGPIGNFLQNLMPRAGGLAGGALAAPPPPQEPAP